MFLVKLDSVNMSVAAKDAIDSPELGRRGQQISAINICLPQMESPLSTLLLLGQVY